MNGASEPYGIVGEFTTAAGILHAAEKVRDAGFRKWDVFTPFPVHGMDRAMGLKNSKVGWFAFLGGVTGYATGMLMIWYMNTFDYPIVIGGKLGFRARHFRNPLFFIFPDMEWQLKLRPQTPNAFFANGLSSQMPVAGTIPRSTPIQTANGAVYPYEDAPVNTGRTPGTTNF